MDAPTNPTPIRRALAVVAAGTFALVGIVACSSSSDALSEDDWREQANGICAETAPAIGEAFAALDPATATPEQLDDVVDTLVEVNRDTGERIDALDEPSALTDRVAALLAANDAATDTVEEQGAAALDTLDETFAPANELATELGLDACAG